MKYFELTCTAYIKKVYLNLLEDKIDEVLYNRQLKTTTMERFTRS